MSPGLRAFVILLLFAGLLLALNWLLGEVLAYWSLYTLAEALNTGISL